MTDKDYTALGRKLRKDIDDRFGKRCGEFDFSCVICNAHHIVDGVDSLTDLLEALKRGNKMHQHKRA